MGIPMINRIRVLLLVSFAGCLVTSAFAQPQTVPRVWFRATLDQLTTIEGEVPKPPDKMDYRQRERRMAMMPRIVVDGDAEAFVGPRVGLLRGEFGTYWYRSPGVKIDALLTNAVVFQAPAGSKVTGTIYLPNHDWSAMSAVRFEVDSTARESISAADFDNVKRRYYSVQRYRGGAGTAWFRHQCLRNGIDTTAGWKWNEHYLMGLISSERTYSERMQLNAMFSEQPIIDVNSIRGVSLPYVDWSAISDEEKPTIDPLAKLIPADQHAIFLSDFSKMIQLIDELNSNGNLLDIFSSRVDQDLTLPKYERQLCLKLDAASRAFGGTVAKSVAITGSDLDLPVGTDIAVLIETSSPQILLAATTAKQQATKGETADCEADDGTIAGVSYFGVKTPDRTVSSYASNVNGTVVVTNSLAQLKRIVETSAGRQAAVAGLDEYKVYRSRYSITNPDETVFLMIPGQAIRRWFGPQWRIAASRRMRAAAVLADRTAASMESLANGSVETAIETIKREVPGLDQLIVSKTGFRSPTYGDISFMTPIIELDRDLVTESEKKAYEEWRSRFGKNYGYSEMVQPTGISLSFKKRKVVMDASVIPLVMNYRLQQLLELAGTVSIRPNAGDRHRGTMLNVTYAFDSNSKNANYRFFMGFLGPLDWVGDSFSVVFEHDPAWQELADAWEKGELVNLSRLPVYLQMEIDNPDGAATSQQKLKNLLKGFGASYVTVEDATYKGVQYTKCIATPSTAWLVSASELSLSFGSTGRQFIVTTSDDLMRRIIDRDQATEKAKGEGKPVKSYGKPWIGDHLAFRADLRLMETFSGFYLSEYQGRMQARSWSNLVILNEWKKRYPNKEAVKLHADVWGQIVRCPGGGTYKWNAEFQTYESTVYGHPARPRVGPSLPKKLQSLERIDFGMTFENEGLRAKAVIDRDPY